MIREDVSVAPLVDLDCFYEKDKISKKYPDIKAS